MEKYAVIKIKNQQFKVSEGDEILVDKLGDAKLEAEILLLVDNGKIKIGKSKVTDAKITLKKLKDVEKGEKLHVRKYKAKSRYRKKIGFRALYTRLKVEKISR